MSDDLNRQHDEFFCPGHEVAPPEKSMTLAAELPAPGKEHPEPGAEYSVPPDEFFKYAGPDKKDRKKKRKMGYLVTTALAAAAVTVGSAAAVPSAGPVLPAAVIELPLPIVSAEPALEPTQAANPGAETDYSFLDGLFGELYDAFSAGRFYDASRLFAAAEELPEGSGMLCFDGAVRSAEGTEDCLMLISFRESESGMSSSGTGQSFVFRLENGNGAGRETCMVYMNNGQTDVLRGALSEDMSSPAAIYESFYTNEDGMFPLLSVRGALKKGHFSGPVVYDVHPFETLDPDGAGTLSDISPTARRYFDLADDGRVHLADIDCVTSDETYAFLAFEDPDCRYFLEKSESPKLCVREYPEETEDNSITYAVYDLNGDSTDELFSVEHLIDAFVKK